MPELAPDPAVVLGLSPRESRADNSAERTGAMHRHLGPPGVSESEVELSQPISTVDHDG